MKTAKEYVERMHSDKEFAAQLREKDIFVAISKAVKELGYEVSPEQVMEINKSGEDISEEELGKIAGGTSCIQILGNQLGMPLTDWP